jgi:uncharacterized protein YhhL (DUF1145 family)
VSREFEHLINIPDKIPNDLKAPLTMLVSLATVMHGCFVEVLNGTPYDELPEEHREMLRAGEELFRAWGKKLGLDVEP